jgi:cystathionine beta-lyase/cystathionine gamma-synthase
MKEFKLGTKAIHGGKPLHGKEKYIGGAVVTPVFQTSTYLMDGAAKYDDIRYLRLSNTPNHIVLGERLADIEGTRSGLVTSSGMSAITTALLALVGPGEHLIAQEALYGGTLNFLQEFLPGMGRQVTYFDVEKPETLAALVKENTRLIYVESISNPTLRLPDFSKVIELAKSKGLLTAIDNTFASPGNFLPSRLGFDVVIHSATKFLNGHSDIVAGAVLSDEKIIGKITHLMNDLGGTLDPHSCFLLERGLKTIELRTVRHNENALRLAKHLEGHAKVRKVHYPGLASHPQFEIAKRHFRGSGGVLSFVYAGTGEETDDMLKKLNIGALAPSLGSVETLVSRPAVTSHLGFNKETLNRLGIEDSLVRVSTGIEDPEDLIADFDQAFE